MEDKINAFGTSCYRIMLNIKRIDRVTNVSIYNLTKTTPLVERARARQLKFLGHILRMPAEEPCREYAIYVPKHGKSKPGRQRTLFLKYTQCLLGDLNDMLDQRQLSAMAQDRCSWRKLVVACSAAERWWWWWWWYITVEQGRRTIPPACRLQLVTETSSTVWRCWISVTSQVQQRPHVVVGAEESQARCWQKATPNVSLAVSRNLEPYNILLSRWCLSIIMLNQTNHLHRAPIPKWLVCLQTQLVLQGQELSVRLYPSSLHRLRKPQHLYSLLPLRSRVTHRSVRYNTCSKSPQTT